MSITKDLYIGSLLVNNVINDDLKELLLKRIGDILTFYFSATET